MQSPVFPARNELRFIGVHGVQVRGEQDGLVDIISRRQPHDEIGTILAVRKGQNVLKFDFQPGAGRDGCQKIRDILLAIMQVGTRGPRVRRKFRFPSDGSASRPYHTLRDEGGIHAGQRDKFGQKFFGTRHGFRVAQASSL